MTSQAEPRAAAVSFSRDALVMQLDDGRTVSVPLDWYPRLRDASAEQRGNWRLIGKGYGIRWPDVDEDVCVPARVTSVRRRRARTKSCG